MTSSCQDKLRGHCSTFTLHPPVQSVSASSSGAILGRSDTQTCVDYNQSPASSSGPERRGNLSGVIACSGDRDKRLHCFATWKNVSGVVQVVKQGCWLDDVNCYDR